MSQVINRVENEVFTIEINQSIVSTKPLNVEQYKLIFPFKGKKGERTLKKVKCHITKLLLEQEGVALVFTGPK